MSVEKPDTEEWLTSTPGVLDGKTRIEGRRLSVHFLGKQMAGGLSPSEVADRYDLQLEAVQAAAQYYRMHQDEMTAIDAYREELLAEAEADPQTPTSPAELAEFTSGAPSASD